ncbi:MAG: hypothetical protein JSU73_05745 [candidate division WOR-3 bacterium]|nr:MAG: hypothetical protein JSU73_05745 [candidate division WOR-3 bacterium]
MSDNEKAAGPAPTAASEKRSRTVGIIACVAGILAALLSLIGVFSRGELDLLYVLLFAGGMLVAVLGVRRLRKARPK